MTKTALVVGSSGIVGSATAARLLSEGWEVLGLARRPAEQAGVRPVAADLQDAAATQADQAAQTPTTTAGGTDGASSDTAAGE